MFFSRFAFWQRNFLQMKLHYRPSFYCLSGEAQMANSVWDQKREAFLKACIAFSCFSGLTRKEVAYVQKLRKIQMRLSIRRALPTFSTLATKGFSTRLVLKYITRLANPFVKCKCFLKTVSDKYDLPR